MPEDTKQDFSYICDNSTQDDERLLKTTTGADTLHWKLSVIESAVMAAVRTIRRTRRPSTVEPECTVGIETLYADDESVQTVLDDAEIAVREALYKALGCTK